MLITYAPISELPSDISTMVEPRGFVGPLQGYILCRRLWWKGGFRGKMKKGKGKKEIGKKISFLVINAPPAAWG